MSSPPEAFRPETIDRFRITDLDFDVRVGTAVLRYALDDWCFEERVAFGPPRAAIAGNDGPLHQALRLLHLVAGVSYYKAAAPDVITVDSGALSPREAALCRLVYDDGLREFALGNHQPVPRRFALGPLADGAPPSVGAAALAHRLAVPLGGGKDSLVLAESVRHLDPLLVTVNPNAMVRGVVAQLGLDAVEIRRSIDPLLLELNARGAYNGHVPATAVVSAIAVVGAVVHGYDRIAMAVERSASEETRMVDGVPVNHQFSKSLQFEEALRAAIADGVAGDLEYFSALRPFSELLIARAFARMPELHPLFCSCNRAFRTDGSAVTGTWCADCDKCRFVALVLAPFLDPEQVVAIFGANLLDDRRQVPGFAQLISADKPFECVGERREAAAALGLLAQRPRWAHSAVVDALAAAARDLAAADPGADAALWHTGAAHHVPGDVLALVRATLGPEDP